MRPSVPTPRTLHTIDCCIDRWSGSSPDRCMSNHSVYQFASVYVYTATTYYFIGCAVGWIGDASTVTSLCTTATRLTARCPTLPVRPLRARVVVARARVLHTTVAQTRRVHFVFADTECCIASARTPSLPIAATTQLCTCRPFAPVGHASTCVRHTRSGVLCGAVTLAHRCIDCFWI
jgi:hypothetical protein